MTNAQIIEVVSAVMGVVLGFGMMCFVVFYFLPLFMADIRAAVDWLYRRFLRWRKRPVPVMHPFSMSPACYDCWQRYRVRRECRSENLTCECPYWSDRIRDWEWEGPNEFWRVDDV